MTEDEKKKILLLQMQASLLYSVIYIYPTLAYVIYSGANSHIRTITLLLQPIRCVCVCVSIRAEHMKVKCAAKEFARTHTRHTYGSHRRTPDNTDDNGQCIRNRNRFVKNRRQQNKMRSPTEEQSHQ